MPLSGHTKTLHKLVGMDGAALACVYPGKATRISSKGLIKHKIIANKNPDP